LIRGLLQALSFAFTSCYTSVNFGIAYSCGLLLIKGYHASPFQVFQVIEALNMAGKLIKCPINYKSQNARFSLRIMPIMLTRINIFRAFCDSSILSTRC
jgi:hypothetical protein